MLRTTCDRQDRLRRALMLGGICAVSCLALALASVSVAAPDKYAPPIPDTGRKGGADDWPALIDPPSGGILALPVEGGADVTAPRLPEEDLEPQESHNTICSCSFLWLA
jgi:hypothetical protein